MTTGIFCLTLKNENKEEFLTYSTFCTLEQIKNIYITEVTIPGSTIQNSFKQVWVILQVCSITVGWHKFEPWTICPKKKFSFSTEWMDNQLDPLSVVSNDAWNIFQKRRMQFIHLNINCILPKRLMKYAILLN